MYDSPVVYKDAEMDFKWKPKNYGRKFHGPTLLRKALAKSYNVVTVKILRDIGIDYTIEYAPGAVNMTTPLKKGDSVLVSYYGEGEDVEVERIDPASRTTPAAAK